MRLDWNNLFKIKVDSNQVSAVKGKLEKLVSSLDSEGSKRAWERSQAQWLRFLQKRMPSQNSI